MTLNASFLVSTFSTSAGVSIVNVADFMCTQVERVTATKFTNKDTFVNFPMDEIYASLSTEDIIIPAHLASADEIDAWLMDL